MNPKPNYDHLYDIAENQAGYFVARQARLAGFNWERLSSNVRTGLFLRITRGIYRLSRFPGSPYEDIVVAWLSTGQKGVVSHDSALSMYDLTDIIPDKIHIIVPRTSSHRRKGIRQHTNQVSADEITQREGLPITTVARTISDVASNGLSEEFVVQAIQEGLQRGLTTKAELIQQAKKRSGRIKQIVDSYFNKKGE